MKTPRISINKENKMVECAECIYKDIDFDHVHNWSGWPGAYCTICGVADPIETCLAGCPCGCHDEFWAEYERFALGEEDGKEHSNS